MRPTNLTLYVGALHINRKELSVLITDLNKLFDRNIDTFISRLLAFEWIMQLKVFDCWKQLAVRTLYITLVIIYKWNFNIN